jgi:hypothetical protein
LDPNNFVFHPSDKIIEFFEDLKGHLEEFKNINNEYIQIKLQEGKNTNKKPKANTQPTEGDAENKQVEELAKKKNLNLEEITLEGEIERTIK